VSETEKKINSIQCTKQHKTPIPTPFSPSGSPLPPGAQSPSPRRPRCRLPQWPPRQAPQTVLRGAPSASILPVFETQENSGGRRRVAKAVVHWLRCDSVRFQKLGFVSILRQKWALREDSKYQRKRKEKTEKKARANYGYDIIYIRIVTVPI